MSLMTAIHFEEMNPVHEHMRCFDVHEAGGACRGPSPEGGTKNRWDAALLGGLSF